MKTVEDIERESREAGDPWAVELSKKAVLPVALLTSPEAVSRMEQLPVTNDQEEAFAAQLLREVKEHWTSIDAQRKTITKPLNEVVKATQAVFKPILGVLEDEERILKDKLAGYAEVKESRNTAALQAAAVAPTPQVAQQAMAFVAPVAAPPGVSIRKVWKFEVTDPDLVPRELCSPDPQKISNRAAVTQDIPGVRFFQESVVTSRRT